MLTGATVGLGASVLGMVGHTQVAAANGAHAEANRSECVFQLVIGGPFEGEHCSDYCSTCEACLCCDGLVMLPLASSAK